MASLIDSWPLVALVVVGVLPHEMWRIVGVVLGRSLDEGSPFFVLLQAVATGLVAALTAQLVLHPPGRLGDVSLIIRLGALGLGFTGFLLLGRSPLAGISIGVGALCMAFALWG